MTRDDSLWLRPKAALGIQGLTVTEVRGFGRQRGHTEHFRGAEYCVDLLPKLKMEVVVTDAQVGEVVSALTSAARTGQVGDGKIYVNALSRTLRIRTGETGNDAVFDPSHTSLPAAPPA